MLSREAPVMTYLRTKEVYYYTDEELERLHLKNLQHCVCVVPILIQSITKLSSLVDHPRWLSI